MSGQSIKVQLTVYVAVGALVISVFVSLISVNIVRQQSTDNAHHNARKFLRDYLDQVGIGISNNGEKSQSSLLRIFYLGKDGDVITSKQISKILDDQFDKLMQSDIEQNLSLNLTDPIDTQTDKNIWFTETVELQVVIESEQEFRSIDRGPDLLSIGQYVTVGEHSFTIGVSYPKSMIENRVKAISILLITFLPVFVLISSIATWFIVDHVLKPVRNIIRDANRITDQRLNQRLEEPKRDNEFRALAKTLNAMLGRIEDVQQVQKRFLSDASHELRSPIAATKLLLEVSQKDISLVDWEDTLPVLVRENDRLIGLVEDLLLMATLDETYAFREFELIALEMVLMQEAERQRDHFVCFKFDTKILLKTDVSQIKILIGNLLDNADRHTKSIISMTMTSTESNVIVSVEDDGPGIPSDQWEIVFNRFARLDTARARSRQSSSERRHSGAGLGLSIVRAIAYQLGGSVSVSDSRLGGACFTFTLALSQK